MTKCLWCHKPCETEFCSVSCESRYRTVESEIRTVTSNKRWLEREFARLKELGRDFTFSPMSEFEDLSRKEV